MDHECHVANALVASYLDGITCELTSDQVWPEYQACPPATDPRGIPYRLRRATDIKNTQLHSPKSKVDFTMGALRQLGLSVHALPRSKKHSTGASDVTTPFAGLLVQYDTGSQAWRQSGHTTFDQNDA
ncbi:hypothetical protein GX51_03401 [Blastomyces parvus]|uniref:Uncharacterized protein n=1 Tax=Blastomyces parvus TaxID=2060905 RepID=A0A2B7X6N7_9EURO|nr:hypothetical protein GX51_03401 [Blastomyces parvus]